MGAEGCRGETRGTLPPPHKKEEGNVEEGYQTWGVESKSPSEGSGRSTVALGGFGGGAKGSRGGDRTFAPSGFWGWS